MRTIHGQASTLLACTALLASACGGGDGGGSSSCLSGQVEVQVFNSTSSEVTVVASSANCTGEVQAPPLSGTPVALFEEDLDADDLVRFEIAGQFIDCTVLAEGVEKTYVRAEVNFAGNLVCDCGFAEYPDNDLCM